MSERDDDVEALLSGVLELIRGGESALKNAQGVLLAMEAGTLSPAAQHKFKTELSEVIAQFKEARLSLQAPNSPRVIPPVTSLDRHDESLANSTVRAEMLTAIDQMEETIQSCRRGLQTSVTVIGGWAHGGRSPNKQLLMSTRDGLEKGMLAMDALSALAQALEQKVRWFDANRA